MKSIGGKIFSVEKTKAFALRSNKFDLLAIIPGVLLFSFALSFIAGSFLMTPSYTNAVTDLSLVGTPQITLNTGSEGISLVIIPTPTGTLASAPHSITTSTNVPTGYNLSLVATNLSGGLTASSGTISAPTPLANNTWGFALASTSAVGVVNDFDASYATPSPSSTSKWANPTTSTLIKRTSRSATNDTTTIYYGARANLDITAGDYTGTIQYTALTNLENIPTPTITSVSPSQGTTSGGTEIQIVGTGFTANDESVTTNVTITNATEGELECTNVSISSNTPSTGQDTIYCTTPAHPTAAAVNIAVTTWNSTVTATGAFTYAAPTATITAPTAGQIFSAGTTNTTLSVTTNFSAICYYGTTTSPSTQMTITGSTTHSQDISGLANQSENTLYVRCQADAGHSYGNEASVNFYVKAPTPTVTITAPSAGQIFSAGTTSATLSVTTDADATCYWGTTENPDTAMTTTGSTTHSQNITGLVNQSTNTVYVRCQVGSGNTASDYSADVSRTFYVRAATPAAPTLTPASGATVNTGTTTINVVRSGTTCTWGTSSGSYPYASGATRTTTTGTNTLYYSCITGSGNTASVAKTGSWSYTGQAPKTYIQTVTASSCTTTRTRVNDARDDNTYWIQKLADGKCWMLTNLAYAGGGTDTYGDTKTISNGSSSSYTSPYYYIPSGANVTSGTTDPSTSTTGVGQYGYLYNWCAAMGGQNTAACANASTPTPDTSISICPFGWRLPTSSEFSSLNTAVNSGSTSSDSGLRSTWLGVYSGYWNNGLVYQGSSGYFWSSTAYDATLARDLYFPSGYAYPAHFSGKRLGSAVRCLLQ